jgi:hypothetical protein
MKINDEPLLNDSEKPPYTMSEPSHTAIGDTKAPTWLRVIARTVGGFLGFALVFIIVYVSIFVALESYEWLSLIVAIIAGLLGGIGVGWFVGRGKVWLRLIIVGGPIAVILLSFTLLVVAFIMACC